VSLVEVPAMAISSSACRERVLAGRPVWYLVPDGVVQYIGKHRLYRGTASEIRGRVARPAEME
jgi:nicotinate-nucleotide adenylyltransferase